MTVWDPYDQQILEGSRVRRGDFPCTVTAISDEEIGASIQITYDDDVSDVVLAHDGHNGWWDPEHCRCDELEVIS